MRLGGDMAHWDLSPCSIGELGSCGQASIQGDVGFSTCCGKEAPIVCCPSFYLIVHEVDQVYKCGVWGIFVQAFSRLAFIGVDVIVVSPNLQHVPDWEPPVSCPGFMCLSCLCGGMRFMEFYLIVCLRGGQTYNLEAHCPR